MADTTPAEIAAAKNLLVIASTWGEGDPPERATDFIGALLAEDAPRFAGHPLRGAGARRPRLRQFLPHRPADRRTRWPRSAAGASRTGSNATSTTKPTRPPGLDRALAADRAGARAGAAVIHVRFRPTASAEAPTPAGAVRGGDHRARQPERQPVEHAHVSRRAFHRRIGPRLRAGRCHRRRAVERSRVGRGDPARGGAWRRQRARTPLCAIATTSPP